MYSYEFPHPAVTVDIVVFTIRDNQLKLLLIRRAYSPYKGKWALPGGFVNIDEGLDEAANRELHEETGVSSVYLEQLYTFGKPKRDPRERVITVAYYALIPSDKMQLQAATDAQFLKAHDEITYALGRWGTRTAWSSIPKSIELGFIDGLEVDDVIAKKMTRTR